MHAFNYTIKIPDDSKPDVTVTEEEQEKERTTEKKSDEKQPEEKNRFFRVVISLHCITF